jgi:uncharacterized protein YdeI (YjbR/CyaY-like superfamily)
MPRRRIGTPGGTADKPALFFSGAEEFDAWLEANHDTATELWMGRYKKHVAERRLTWEDAVVVALRWGWIDSRAERIDDDAMRQRFTPRKPGSNWSAINVATVERLIAQGRMTPAGLAAYDRRRLDRSGVYAYEQPHGELAPEFAARLASDKAAAAFWDHTTPAYRRIAINWVMTAKQEATREKRINQLIDDCAHGRLIPSHRYGTPPKWVGRAAEAARRA